MNNHQEDIILHKIKELLSVDLTTMTYTDIPHILIIITKIVYEENHLDPSIQRDLIINIAKILIDNSSISPSLKFPIKEMVPHFVDKYIQIDNGSVKLKIRTYGKIGNLWIKIRSFFDRIILGLRN